VIDELIAGLVLLAMAVVGFAASIRIGILVGLRLDRRVETRRGGEPGGDRP
jgi:hypothetical protein